MPTMASMTVKKADGTTDIVYDALAASGGDSSPAIWRQDTGAVAGLPNGLKALLKLFSGWNGPKTARVLRFQYRRPYATQDTTTSLYSSKDAVVVEVTCTVPQNMPASEASEGVYQGLNLASHSLVKTSMNYGFAPN